MHDSDGLWYTSMQSMTSYRVNPPLKCKTVVRSDPFWMGVGRVTRCKIPNDLAHIAIQFMTSYPIKYQPAKNCAAVAVGNSKVKFCVRFNKILGYQYLFETGEYCNGLHPVSFDLVLYKHALNILLNRSATCSLALVAEWENIKALWASLYQSPQNLCNTSRGT